MRTMLVTSIIRMKKALFWTTLGVFYGGNSRYFRLYAMAQLAAPRWPIYLCSASWRSARTLHSLNNSRTSAACHSLSRYTRAWTFWSALCSCWWTTF